MVIVDCKLLMCVLHNLDLSQCKNKGCLAPLVKFKKEAHTIKYCFYTLLSGSESSKVIKGFSNADDRGNFLLFPMSLSQLLPIGTFLKGSTGVIRIYEKDVFIVEKENLIRLYYK